MEDIISPEESRFLQLMDMMKAMDAKIDYNKTSLEGQIKVFQLSTMERLNSEMAKLIQENSDLKDRRDSSLYLDVSQNYEGDSPNKVKDHGTNGEARRRTMFSSPKEHLDQVQMLQTVPNFTGEYKSKTFLDTTLFFDEVELYMSTNNVPPTFIQNHISPYMANCIKAYKKITHKEFLAYSVSDLKTICFNMVAPLTAVDFISAMRSTVVQQLSLKTTHQIYNINPRNFHNLLDKSQLVVTSLMKVYSDLLIYTDPNILKVRFKKDKDAENSSLVELTEELLQEHIMTIINYMDTTNTLRKPHSYPEYMATLSAMLVEFSLTFKPSQLTMWQCIMDFNKDRHKPSISQITVPRDTQQHITFPSDTQQIHDEPDSFTALDVSLSMDESQEQSDSYKVLEDNTNLSQVSFNKDFKFHDKVPSKVQVPHREPTVKILEKPKQPCFTYFRFKKCDNNSCTFDHSKEAMDQLYKEHLTAYDKK